MRKTGSSGGGKKKPPGDPAVSLERLRAFQLRVGLSSAGAVREPKVAKKEGKTLHGGRM
jgi:hypothetical protein